LNIRNLDEYDTLQLKSNIYQADFDYYNKIVTTSYENKFDGIRWDNFIDVPDLQNIFPKEPIDFIATTFIVFEPTQIKLADGTNTTFDGNNADIRFEKGGVMSYREYVDTQFDEEEDRYLPSGYLREFEIQSDKKDLYPILYRSKNGFEYRIKSNTNSDIGVFDGDKMIGYADNKAIVVAPLYQKKGIGLELVIILKERNPDHRFGSMTPEGWNLLGKYYDEKIAKKSDSTFDKGGILDFVSSKSLIVKIGNDSYKIQYQKDEIGSTEKNVWFANIIAKNEIEVKGRLCYADEYVAVIHGMNLNDVTDEIMDFYKSNDLYLIIQDEYGKVTETRHIESNDSDIFAKGGRTIAQTPAPKSDRVYGSKTNPKGSASDSELAKSIKFNDNLEKAIENKVIKYNDEHPMDKVRIQTAKAVVRRGMGAYSKSHRPTISGGAPNSRQAWGLARLNKFLLKKSGVKVKSAYIQDDDLLKYAKGGQLQADIKANAYLKPSNCTDVADVEYAFDVLRELDAKYGEDNPTLLKLWAKMLERKKYLLSKSERE
jgi:GNAT superfamily N-acetyltransferase